VIGVPHDDYGEAVVAVVVKDKDRADVTDESLRVALETQLGGYKIPKRIIFTAELPRNAMGKVLKNVLRDEYCYQSAVGRGA
jgi:malonyl-CoA/methylmalonyl-CoA synthetase